METVKATTSVTGITSNKPLVDAKGLADHLGVSTRWVWRATRRSTIPYVALEGEHRASYRYDVDQVLKHLGKPAESRAPQEADKRVISQTSSRKVQAMLHAT